MFSCHFLSVTFYHRPFKTNKVIHAKALFANKAIIYYHVRCVNLDNFIHDKS